MAKIIQKHSLLCVAYEPPATYGKKHSPLMQQIRKESAEEIRQFRKNFRRLRKNSTQKDS